MLLLNEKNPHFARDLLASHTNLPSQVRTLLEASLPHIDAYQTADPVLRNTLEKITIPYHRAQEGVCLAIRRILPIAINVDDVNWLLEGGYVQHAMDDVEIARSCCQAAIDVFYGPGHPLEDFFRQQDPGSKYRPALAEMALMLLSIDEEGREWPTAYLKNHPDERNYTEWTQVGLATRFIKFEHAPFPTTELAVNDDK